MLISLAYLGKTTFLFYLLLYRLERKLPTAIQLGALHYFIFDEQGAKVHSLSESDPRLEKCWALTDSNDVVSQPCEVFKARAERAILTSSPKPERWKEWIKQKNGYCIISDLPSVPEIAAIASVGLVLICWISLLTKPKGKSSGSDRNSSRNSSCTIHLPLCLSCASGDHLLGTSSAAWSMLSLGNPIPSNRPQERLR
jgi:hypothetical protein